MNNLHKGVVLRSPSPLKTALIVLDEQYGKIEAIPSYNKKGYSLSSGAVISYIPKKLRVKYSLGQVTLVDMPFYWAQNDLLFFHHVIELCDHFLQWDEPSPEVFQLVDLLYSTPSSFKKKEAQRLFLYQLFSCFGMAPDLTTTTFAQWFRTCIATQFQAESLNTAAFLKLVDCYEDCS